LATRSATAVLRAVRSAVDTLPAGRRPRVLIFGESLGATAAAAAAREVGGVDGCLLVGRPGSAGGAAVPGCTDVRNDDDPIPWWGPGLLVSPRSGLPWLPGGTFWQMTGGLVTSLDQPLGHGHRYGGTLADGWARLPALEKSSYLHADYSERADPVAPHRMRGVAGSRQVFRARIGSRLRGFRGSVGRPSTAA
jgi:uncharacterized membrane protein